MQRFMTAISFLGLTIFVFFCSHIRRATSDLLMGKTLLFLRWSLYILTTETWITYQLNRFLSTNKICDWPNNTTYEYSYVAKLVAHARSCSVLI